MNVVSLLTATLALATAFSAFGQEPVASPPTPLSQLLAEAGQTTHKSPQPITAHKPPGNWRRR
ncbi:MAG TPA: hypothetical protein VK638_13155 [Edaphobacter sp.]|nr:hypothetical protein [Edaphobacter sp.]